MSRDPEKLKQWQIYNKEKIRLYSKQWRQNNLAKNLEAVRKYRRNHRELVLERSRKYYAEVRYKKAAITSREWRAKNPERAKFLRNKWSDKNPEKVKKTLRHWLDNNKDWVNYKSRIRRALKANAPGSHTQKDIEHIRNRQKNKCYWCKNNVKDKYHVDHVWPLSKGGGNGPENLVISCPRCNVRKKDKTPMEFAGVLL